MVVLLLLGYHLLGQVDFADSVGLVDLAFRRQEVDYSADWVGCLRRQCSGVVVVVGCRLLAHPLWAEA